MIVSEEKTKIKNAEDVAKIMRNIYEARPEEEQHKEHFYIIGLNSESIILYIDLVSIGTVNHASPALRECLRLALIKNAVSIIAIHNHPSGNSHPSTEDNIFTRQLKEATRLIGISLLDHLILGNDYLSYADSGLL